MWIDDVVSHATIRSTWGNSIRDRVVKDFANAADRDSHTAQVVDGTLATTADDQRLWRKHAGVWLPALPYMAQGTNGADTNLANGQVFNNAVTMQLPAGYRWGLFTWMVLLSTPAALDWRAEARLYTAGGGNLIGAAQQWGHANGASVTLVLSSAWTVNAAGEGCVGTIQNITGVANSVVGVNMNNFYSRLSALLIP